MTHRLRRMVLVNARTSGSTPSGRIVEIDPRGGAAIIGANSVGKTSTLELLPLFLGHSPSDLADPRAATGRQPMLQYVLPTPQSAIIFEYQRGPSEEDDVRFVCMRRAAGDIAAEYRLFKGPFRKELFVKATAEHGLIFLDDEGSVLAANTLGVKYHPAKLDCASYRRVILAFRKKTEDEPRLRAVSHDFCLGPVNQSLAHLDSLVAAVVKKHISFDDFRHVAVEMVQQELGAASVGNQRTRLELRQGRQQIRTWLDDRDACAEAVGKAPEVEKLRDLVRRHAKGVEMLQVLRGEVSAMRSAKDAARQTAARSMNEAQETRKLTAAAEQITLERLTEELATAQNEHARAEVEHRTQEAALKQFNDGKDGSAAYWAGEMSKQPALEQTRSSLAGQIRSAEETTTKYAVDIADEKAASEKLLAAQERRKEGPHKAFDAASRTISAQEVQRVAGQARIFAPADEIRTQEIAALEQGLNAKKAFIAKPRASAELQEALNEANALLQQHYQRVNAATTAQSKADKAASSAHATFDEAERKLTTAKGNLVTAQTQEQEALDALRPAPGTLLHTLRAHPNDAWRGSLAKILNPGLLKLTDLDGSDCTVELAALDDPSGLDPAGLAFGFRVATSTLPVPSWVDGTQASPRHEAAKAHTAKCKLAVEEAERALLTASSTRRTADTELVKADAAKAIADGRTAEIEGAQDAAKERVANDLTRQVAAAKESLAELTQQLKELKDLHAQQRKNNETKLQEIREEFAGLLQQAEAVRDRELAGIQDEISREPARLAQRIESLERQRDEQLRSEGVDMERLATLRAECAEVTRLLNAIEGKAALVTAWHTWNDEVGPAGLAKRKADVSECASRLAQARTRLADHNTAASQAHTLHAETMKDAEEAIGKLDSEGALLEGLGSELQEFDARPYVGTEDLAKSSAESLRTRTREAEREHRDTVGTLTSLFNNLKSAFTARENSLQRLMNLKLQLVAGNAVADQAAALLEAYAQLPQAVSDVNHTLGTVLAKVSQFYKDIQDFESEISAFNTKLQNGMPQVSGFPWLKKMKLNIVTNFSDLEYMSKLKALSVVAQEHNRVGGKDGSLPSPDAGLALRDFLSIMGVDGSLAINLSSHVKLSGSMQIKGVDKSFRTEGELEHIDSNGITSIVLISLLSGMLNTIRKDAPLYISWVTDEVGKFDPANFTDLMEMLRQNRIDVITASPELTPAKIDCFARCYEFEDQGRVGVLETLETEGA